MFRSITSRQNPRIKQALRLRDHKDRTQTGLFLIDGLREIRQAVEAGLRIREAFVGPEGGDWPEAETLAESLQEAGADVRRVNDDVLDRLGFGQRFEGLVVVSEARSTRLQDLPLGVDALIAVVEGVEKPGNLGAILRTADGAGVSAVMAADPKSDPYNPNCIRASLGTVFRVPLAVAPSADVRPWLLGQGFRVFATRPGVSIRYTEADFTGPVAIVLGAEAEGLSPDWDIPDVTAISLPMLGTADSLNVSATAAVLFYEALRQRGLRSESPES